MAAEFATSVDTGVVENLVELYVVSPALRNLRYVFCFQNIVEEFNEQKQLLSSAQTRLQNDVEEARRQTLEIERGVKKWLEEADKVMEEVESLENEIQEKKKPCLIWCPNWNCRYRLGKKIAKTKLGIVELVKSSKFEPNRIDHRATLPNFLPSKDFVPSEFSTSVLNRIWEDLKNDSVNMIGVLGMGGVVKTTLVKEIGKKAEELRLFDEDVMTTVSQNSVTNYQLPYILMPHKMMDLLPNLLNKISSDKEIIFRSQCTMITKPKTHNWC